MSGPRLVWGHESKQLVGKHRNRENRLIKKRDKNASAVDREERQKTAGSDTGTDQDWYGVTVVHTKTNGVTLLQSKIVTEWQWYRLADMEWLVHAKTDTERHWYRRRLHGVTMVGRTLTWSDNGTGQDWHGVTMVQAKTDTEWQWYRRKLYGVTMVQAKTGTQRKLELESQSEVLYKHYVNQLAIQQYKHYVNQSANRITVIPTAIFAVLLFTFRLYCTNCNAGGYLFCSSYTVPTARGTAADSISTSNNNYFG